MTDEKRCPGCYDSFSGPWCDNCDQWPCICLNEDEPKPLWGDGGPAVGQAITIAGTTMQTRWTGTHWELVR